MKKGITMSIVLVAIVVMMLIITAATVVGKTTIDTANYEEFKSSLSRLADNVNEYYIKNKTLPVKNEIIATNSLDDDFKLELDKKGDLNEKLFIVDMSKIDDASISIGRGDVNSKDIFLVSQTSQNIYYLKGYKFKNITAYGVL